MSDKRTFGVIAEKLSFFNKLSLLSNAVADTEEPTPGYMYQEIANISYESGAYCADLLEHLVSQLSSKSCNVKYKVLKILRYVVENGHPDFRSGLRKQSLGITDAIQFSGPSHPTRGMEPYIKVRQEAAALSEVLFSDVDSAQASQQRPSQLQLAGMGSSNQGLVGFGNTKNTTKSSLVHSVREFAEKVLSPPKPGTFTDDMKEKKFGEYEPANLADHMTEMSVHDSSGSVEPSRSSGDVNSSMVASKSANSRKRTIGRKKGVAGGGWAEDDNDMQPNSQSADTCVHTPPDTTHTEATTASVTTQALAHRLEQVQNNQPSAEERLVDDITGESDTFILSHGQIKAFTKECAMLNCDVILERLGARLKVEQESVQMKSMLVLEGLLRTDHVTADQVVSVCSGELLTIHNNYSHDRRTAKARKILRILEKLSSSPQLIVQEA